MKPGEEEETTRTAELGATAPDPDGAGRALDQMAARSRTAEPILVQDGATMLWTMTLDEGRVPQDWMLVANLPDADWP